MNYRPVFIGGCDRSGTTLLGDLLGAGRWTLTTPESQFVHELLLHMKLESFETSTDTLHWLQNNFRFASWGLHVNAYKLAHVLESNDSRYIIEYLVHAYARQYVPHKTYADVWIDHTPDNFKYHAMLKAAFPEARFIHIVRDGRAVCSSIKDLNWGPNNAYKASRHWSERLQQALALESAEGSNCYRVYYEDLVSNPEYEIAEICNFIDVPYDSEMLQGGGLRLPNFTRNQHQLVGKAPQSANAIAWRQKLSHREIRDFESYPFSRLLLERMGYQLEFSESPNISTFHTLSCYCHDFLMYLWNRMKHRSMERRVVNDYQSTQTSSEKNILGLDAPMKETQQ